MKTKNADGRLQESDLDIAEKIDRTKKDDEPITACMKGELTGDVLFNQKQGGNLMKTTMEVLL